MPPIACLPAPRSDLEAAGIASLGQLLELYPRRQITSLPGRLPEPDDADPTVTLAVRRTKRPVSVAREWLLLRAAAAHHSCHD